MNFKTIINVGKNSKNTEDENAEIELSNFISLGFILLTTPFIIFEMFFMPSVLYLTSMFQITCILSLLCNYLRMYEITKLLLSFFLSLIFTLFHAFVMQIGDLPIATLFLLQLCIAILPWFLFSQSENTKMYVYLFINMILFVSVPYLNPYLEDILDNSYFKNTDIITSIISVISIIGISLGIGYSKFINEKNFLKTNQILDLMQLETEKSSQKEQELNTYISEIDKNKILENQRNWAATGKATFATTLRNSDNITVLGDNVVYNIVTYLNVNQAAFFMDLNDENPENAYLELVACYAYDRKKYLKKHIEPGEGLVGQVYLEKKYLYLDNIPAGYSNITSGLGSAAPKYLLLMPLISKDEIEGVIEIASFQPIEKYKIDFMEELTEEIASVITSVKIAENTKKLLLTSQVQTEQLRSQEEEMRQNMEEMMATQEEVMRRQIESDSQSEMLNLIINNIPFPIFLKNSKGDYTMVNDAEAKLFNKPKNEILGKNDADFVTNKDALVEIKKSDNHVVETLTSLELPLQQIVLENGKQHVFKTIKTPFLDKRTNEVSILGISIEITKNLSKEEEDLQDSITLNNNITINLAGRQRMLSQKIGFLSFLVMEGESDVQEELSATMQFFEETLFIFKNGGVTSGLNPNVTITKLDSSLNSKLFDIEKSWEVAKSNISILENPNISKNEKINRIKNSTQDLLEKSNSLVEACSKL